jgi:hemoglobin/transferrin/lactoferrin receptor protein
VSSNYDSLVLGAAGLVWLPNSDLVLRANLSQGYIYPTLGQMFLTATGGDVTLEGNPDLKPERATTFELGARYNAGATTLDATVFYTDATDYITTVSDGTTGTYENVDQAKSWALEIYAEHDLDLWKLAPYASLSAMRRQLCHANGYKTFDSGTPDLFGRIGLRKVWDIDQVSGTFDLYVRGESGVAYRDDSGAITDSTSGYGMLNLRTDVDFGNGMSLVTELINLTDRSYTPYGQMPGAERSVNLFLTKTF